MIKEVGVQAMSRQRPNETRRGLGVPTRRTVDFELPLAPLLPCTLCAELVQAALARLRHMFIGLPRRRLRLGG